MKSVGELKPEPSTTSWILRYRGRGILTVTLLSRMEWAPVQAEPRVRRSHGSRRTVKAWRGSEASFEAFGTPIALISYSKQSLIGV
jgi:hypothetical protein